MSIYAVPLQQLARLRRGPKHEPAGFRVDQTDRCIVGALRGESATSRTEKVESARDVPAAEAASVASADHLLNLSPSQLAAYLEEPRGSGSKVLLAVIYRLATIEQQLDDLGSYLRGGNAGRSFHTPADLVQPVVGDAGKAGVLEQVFRKNLSLRETI